MAINKNFVIKNGVQVATDLIVGDSDTKKVGIGTTIAGYTLHVGATNVGGRGGIGATDLNITGVGTVTNFNVTGLSTFANDISVSGMVSAQALSIGTTEVIDRGLRLSGIASLDATTTATIEEAIRVGPNSFSDLKVSGISTFVGIATFATGLDVVSGVSTFGAPLRIGFAGTTDHAGVALGATVGFGTSAFFQDGAAIYMGDDSDLKIFHDSSNSFIQDLGTGNLYVDSNSLQIRNATGTETQAVFTENGSVELYFDNSKKVETTSGGLNVTGITTFSDRLNVVSGVSTFQDNAKLTFGGQGDLLIYHDASHSYITNATGDLNITSGTTDPIILKTDDFRVQNQAGSEFLIRGYADTSVYLFYNNSNVFQTTPQGVNVSGVTTTNRLIVSGISTFSGNLDINASIDVSGNTVLNGDVDLGNATSDTITATGRFDSDIVPSTDNARDLGASGLEFKDLYIDGTANIDTLSADTAAIGDLTDNRVVIAGSSGELEDDGNFTFDGNQLKVGLGTIQVNGNAAFAGIVTIGGNLNVTGDIVYDEVSGRNLNISGITTLGSGNGGVSGLQVTGAGYVGGGATVGSNGPGIVTYYGDGGNLTGVTIGIGTTGDGSAGLHPVGYGVTYLEFRGAGFTTAYYDGVLGIATLYFQGGGNAGAAGTWVPFGDAGIATTKSVGVGTIGMGVTSLQGGVKGASSGIGNSFSGLYIGNGMMVVDNALNGDHYIGTSYNGLMAGPVTINGVLTVDGNYVVV